MSTCRRSYLRSCVVIGLVVALGLADVRASGAETPEEAIRRIQAGQHTPMPPPSTAPASGAAGKGMTIENGTGYALHVHFSGPVSRTVVVPNRRSESVELVVGDYQVAAEVPGSGIVPFYGRQAYDPFTHYWLKFYTQVVDAPKASSPSGASPSQHGARGASSASARSVLGWQGLVFGVTTPDEVRARFGPPDSEKAAADVLVLAYSSSRQGFPPGLRFSGAHFRFSKARLSNVSLVPPPVAIGEEVRPQAPFGFRSELRSRHGSPQKSLQITTGSFSGSQVEYYDDGPDVLFIAVYRRLLLQADDTSFIVEWAHAPNGRPVIDLWRQ